MESLMNDVVQDIFTFLTVKEVLQVSQVCHKWSAVIGGKDEVALEMNVLWYRLLLRDFGSTITQEELNKMIENSRLIKTDMNKGQLKRMRRNKKHLKKTACENFKLRELASYWRRMYFNTMENSKKSDTLEPNMKDLFIKYLEIGDNIFSNWKVLNCKHDLVVQSRVEQGFTKHTVHCGKCHLIMSTTELSISKKVYGDFYGHNRARYYPLKLFPVSFYYEDSGKGYIHPLSRGQFIHKLWKTKYRFDYHWADEYIDLEVNEDY
jgi:hypothetical protein